MKKLLTSLLLLPLISFGQTTSTTSATKTVFPNLDTLITYSTKTTTITSRVIYDTLVSKSIKYDTLKYVASVINPATAMPGGLASKAVSYSYKSNFNITGLSFNGAGQSIDLLTLNNCSNVTITLCRFSNTGGRSIVLNNCSNITIKYNFCTGVGFGVDAIGCTGGIKVDFNQGLNLWQPALYNGNFAHFVQFWNCNGAGMEVNDNTFVNVDFVAYHPHDCISIGGDAGKGSNGTTASPIYICRNKIFGGQIAGGWPSSGNTGVGITAPDVAGSNYVIQGNIVVNSGVNGIICVGTGSNILVDNNIMLQYDKNAKVSYDGFTISGSKTNMRVTNNRVRWMQSPSSYLGYWFGGSSTFPGVTFSNNNWNDATLTPTSIPAITLSYK